MSEAFWPEWATEMKGFITKKYRCEICDLTGESEQAAIDCCDQAAEIYYRCNLCDCIYRNELDALGCAKWHEIAKAGWKEKVKEEKLTPGSQF